MSTEAHKFKVGLFVIGGIVLLAGGLIWLGASKILSETRPYVTYFDESVQGLETGSQVKFMGVAIGSVAKVKIAPDGKLVEARMELESEFKQEEDMRIELAMAGITGMKYLEITRDASGKPIELSFEPEVAYIPSSRSGTAEILDKFDKIYKRLMDIDFQGISDEVKGTLHSATGRINDPKVDRLMEAITGSAERLRYLLEKKQTENTIDEIEATIGELKGLVQGIRDEVEGMDLKGTFANLRQTVEGFNQMIERLDNEVAATLVNVRRTSDNLKRITEKVSQDPAQTLLSEPPPERNDGSREGE